jgi:hypothetical protein
MARQRKSRDEWSGEVDTACRDLDDAVRDLDGWLRCAVGARRRRDTVLAALAHVPNPMPGQVAAAKSTAAEHERLSAEAEKRIPAARSRVKAGLSRVERLDSAARSEMENARGAADGDGRGSRIGRYEGGVNGVGEVWRGEFAFFDELRQRLNQAWQSALARVRASEANYARDMSVPNSAPALPSPHANASAMAGPVITKPGRLPVPKGPLGREQRGDLEGSSVVPEWLVGRAPRR